MSEVKLALISTNEDILLIRSFCKCTPDILREKNIIVYKTWPATFEEVRQFKSMGIRCLNLSNVCQCKN